MGVPHGVTSCIMCPAVMKYNIQYGKDIPEIAERQKIVRDILWSEPEVANTLKAAGLEEDRADLGDLLDAIIGALGLPRNLRTVGIKREDLPTLSERALVDFWALSNPIPLAKASQVQEILNTVFE